jgi:hypothetical protein
MIIELNKASDSNYKEEIEVNTIEDLCKIMDENKAGLVIKFNGLFETNTKNGIRVIIYDDYIE